MVFHDRVPGPTIILRLVAVAVLAPVLNTPVLNTPVWAQERLFDEAPFDRIKLNEANDNEVLEVRPLDLPGRRVPVPLPRSGKLVVRLCDRPEQAYEVQWYAIVEVELFEQLLLKKARELASASKLDEAYDYFKFLEANYPQLPDLGEEIEKYLYREAVALHGKKQYHGALAMLRELYRRNPKRAGLDKALGIATDTLLAQYVAKDDYQSARTLLRNLAIWFPEQTYVVKWESTLKEQAAARLAEALRAERTGDLVEAARKSRQVTRIWPELSGAKQLAQSLHQRHPRVVVGVSLPAVDLGPGRLNDWAARRSGRLVYRTLTEFAGPGSAGGTYRCPVGKMDTQQPDRLSLRIERGIRFSSGETALTGYDVSRLLLAMADPRDPAYRADWGELLESVTVHDVYRVEAVYRLEAGLRRTHVRPDALLQTVLVPYTAVGAPKQVSNGPYRKLTEPRTGNEITYLANTHYFAAGPEQPKEIAERHYRKGAKAIRALKRGEIDVLDRVNPWSLDAVRTDVNLVLEPYGAPLVHCLIPNMRKPLTARRTFRRALVYGIHREAILSRLLGGGAVPERWLVSGPFPPGLSDDDPIGYACDPDIKPRDYKPYLAMALAEVSRRQLAAGNKKKGQPPGQLPRLVLAHPPNDIARVACTSIQRQLGLIGIVIDLRELPGGVPKQIPEGVDLLYAELAMWEPVTDARRVLGEDGMAAGCSPYMSLALRQLGKAANWEQVNEKLHAIHRFAHDDVAVVPLWQLIDHFAYRKSLGGIGTKPVSLYQNIEQWQPAFRYAAE